jgi:hypothetical protein
MGQTLSTIVGYLLIFIVKLEDKYKEYFKQETRKDYYNNDILLKDDEQKASKY